MDLLMKQLGKAMEGTKYLGRSMMLKAHLWNKEKTKTFGDIDIEKFWGQSMLQPLNSYRFMKDVSFVMLTDTG